MLLITARKKISFQEQSPYIPKDMYSILAQQKTVQEPFCKGGVLTEPSLPNVSHTGNLDILSSSEDFYVSSIPRYPQLKESICHSTHQKGFLHHREMQESKAGRDRQQRLQARESREIAIPIPGQDDKATQLHLLEFR